MPRYNITADRILDGVAEASVALPPEIDRLKSDASDPLPVLVLKTASLRVTAIVALSDAREVAVIVGDVISETVNTLTCPASEPLPLLFEAPTANLSQENLMKHIGQNDRRCFCIYIRTQLIPRA